MHRDPCRFAPAHGLKESAGHGRCTTDSSRHFPRTLSRSCALLSGCALLAMTGGVQAEPYVLSFQWMPGLEFDDGIRVRTSSFGASINSSGVVTGGGGRQALRWDGTVLESFTPGWPETGPANNTSSTGMFINDHGQVLGTTVAPDLMWIWDGEALDLGTLETPENVPFALVPSGLNNASVAAGMAFRTTNSSDARAWVAPDGDPLEPVAFPEAVLGLEGAPAWTGGSIAINNHGDLLLSGRIYESMNGPFPSGPVLDDWRYLVTSDGAELALPDTFGPGVRLNDSLQALFTSGDPFFSAHVLYDIGTDTIVWLDDADYFGPGELSDLVNRSAVVATDINNEGLVAGWLRLDGYDDMSPLRFRRATENEAAMVWVDGEAHHLKSMVQASPFATELGDGYLTTASAVADGGWITGTGFVPSVPTYYDEDLERQIVDGGQRGFRMQLGFTYLWANAEDGQFAEGGNWSGGVVPTGGNGAMFDVPGAYTVSFDAPAEHRDATVLAGDVGFALDGHEYRVRQLSVQSTDDLSVRARVLGSFVDSEGATADDALPDGRLVAQEVFVGPRGILGHQGWLLVGEGALDDLGTMPGRDAAAVDLHVLDGLRIAAGGGVGGADLGFGALVDGIGDSARVEIDGVGSVMRHHRVEVGGIHGGRIEVTDGGRLLSDTVLAVGGSSAVLTEVIVDGFGVDLDGGIHRSTVETPSLLLGEPGPADGPRVGLMTVEAGANLLADQVVLGRFAGSTGELELRGAGTRLAGLNTPQAELDVGIGGEGRMLIAAGAQAAAATTIGASLPHPDGLQFGEGSVTVAGLGAAVPADSQTLLDSPLLIVGDTGVGTLTITDGARVETNRALIGQFGTGFGTVVVQGEGSTLDLGFDGSGDDIGIVFPELWVGRDGVARLQVLDGGSVVVAPDDAGIVQVGSALVEIRNGGSITSGAANIGPGATVIGDAGSWHIPEEFTMNLGGRLQIGASPGEFLLGGNLKLLDTGVMAFEFAGRTPGLFDVLEVTGDLHLGGTLELSFIDGFLPEPGDFFEFLKVSGSVFGEFDLLNLNGAPDGLDLDIAFEGGSLRMRAGNGMAHVIPLPAAGWLLLAALGMFGIAGRLGRSRRASF